MPDAFLAGVPPVNKLTLLKSNKELRDSDEEKRSASENSVLEEKMDTRSTQKTKQKQRRKNATESGSRMEVEEGSKGSKELKDKGEKMEVSQKTSKRGRHKKGDSNMDTSQIDDA